jgi:hypothetical protein
MCSRVFDSSGDTVVASRGVVWGTGSTPSSSSSSCDVNHAASMQHRQINNNTKYCVKAVMSVPVRGVEGEDVRGVVCGKAEVRH